MLGFLVGCAIMFGTAFVVFKLTQFMAGEDTANHTNIAKYVVFGIWYFFWFNGDTSWEDFEGDIDFGAIFASLLFHAIEIASGAEFIFGLDPGTLGGWE